jgi:peptide-methionine (S)-S-oxide reductase
MRGKYRSAIYAFNDEQEKRAKACLTSLQRDFAEPLVTQVLPFVGFKASDDRYQNYYATAPERPFCKTYIDPKLAVLRKDYADRLRVS